jgi:carbon-monoxide dehydrogenase medium subunit
MPKTFEYHRPGDLNEAYRLLDELPDARVLAGVTDLLFDIDSGLRRAQHVVSLRDVEGLDGIEVAGDHVAIGAGCTARQLQYSRCIRILYRAIAETVSVFASPQIRSRATIAGNICSAVPCGDFPVILIALGSQVELGSVRGTRKMLLRDFFLGPRETKLKAGEILTRILVPEKHLGSSACYLKFQRRASNSLAVASVGAFLDIQKGKCQVARIVLGAVAPTPLFAQQASDSLVGEKVNEKAIARAAELARDEAMPITDVRGSEDFRRELIGVLTRRALEQVAERIEKQPK